MYIYVYVSIYIFEYWKCIISFEPQQSIDFCVLSTCPRVCAKFFRIFLSASHKLTESDIETLFALNTAEYLVDGDNSDVGLVTTRSVQGKNSNLTGEEIFSSGFEGTFIYTKARRLSRLSEPSFWTLVCIALYLYVLLTSMLGTELNHAMSVSKSLRKCYNIICDDILSVWFITHVYCYVFV